MVKKLNGVIDISKNTIIRKEHNLKQQSAWFSMESSRRYALLVETEKELDGSCLDWCSCWGHSAIGTMTTTSRCEICVIAMDTAKSSWASVSGVSSLIHSDAIFAANIARSWSSSLKDDGCIWLLHSCRAWMPRLCTYAATNAKQTLHMSQYTFP